MTIDTIDTRIKKVKLGKKGFGFIATEFIPKNTVILSEYPSFKIDGYKSSEIEIFELLYVILTSSKKEYKKKFMKYLPKTIDNNLNFYVKKIKEEFNNLKLKNYQMYNYFVTNYDINEIVLFSLKYICNAFDFFEEGPIILLNGSIFNHSCNPNIIFGKSIGKSPENNKSSKMNFITIRDINKGEELQNCYINIFESTKERKKKLLNQYGFNCECDKCDTKIFNDQVLKNNVQNTKNLFSNLKFNNV